MMTAALALSTVPLVCALALVAASAIVDSRIATRQLADATLYARG